MINMICILWFNFHKMGNSLLGQQDNICFANTSINSYYQLRCFTEEHYKMFYYK